MGIDQDLTAVEPDSFERMYRAEVHPIALIATAMTGNREIGLELTHEAMLRAFREWPRVGAFDRPGAWVRRVVINLAHDSNRRHERERRALDRTVDDAIVEPPSPVGSFWREVRRLPRRQREVVALRYIDDLSVSEIASTLAISEGTVKRALFAARRHLSEVLGVEVDGADHR